MSDLLIEKSLLNISNDNIVSLENLVGYSIPQDFVNFYLLSNGGIANNPYFYIEYEDNYVEISLFLPIYYTDEKLGGINIETSYKHLIQSGFPNKFLPFGIDWGGNFFALDLETGKIVLLLMDLGPFTDNCVKYIASCFSDYINNLVKSGDEDN